MNPNHKRIKREFKRQYIPIIVASVLLIIIVAALILIVLFFKEDYSDEVEAPEWENISLGVVEDPKKMNTLKHFNTFNYKIKYKLIKDLYKKERIKLSFVETKMVEDKEFLIRSSFIDTKNDKAFVAKVNLKGKMEWFTVFSEVKYDNIQVYDVFKYKNAYYLIATGKYKNRSYLLAMRIDRKGKVDQIKELKKDFDSNIFGIYQTKDRIAIVIQKASDLTVMFIDYNSYLTKGSYSFIKENKFEDTVVNVYNAKVADNKLIMLCHYLRYDQTLINYKDFILNIDLSDLRGTIYPIKDVSDKLDNMISREGYFLDNSILIKTQRDVLSRYSFEGKYIEKIDYSKVELGKNIEDPGDTTDNITIKDVKNNIVTFNTSQYRVYDIINNNATISKRYIYDISKYNFYANLVGTYFYKDKIYEIYNYLYNGNMPVLMLSIME